MAEKKQKRPKKRRSALLDILNGLLMLVVLGIVIIGGVIYWGAQQFYAEGPTHNVAIFQIERGNGLATVSQRLEDAGLISNRWVFQAGAVALKKERGLKTGEYEIPASASMSTILKTLTEGTPITYAVTIPEGFTSWQVVQRLDAEDALTGTINGVPEEGSLMPDTYAFERGDNRNDIIARMQKAQETALATIWAGRDPDLPLKTPQDLVTLASIVEKETGVPDERARVAAVFINRLKRGMRLQSDPTIIYGITNGQGPLGRGLKKSEIEQKNDYNTYQIDGLPVGPIANPGLSSMEAVAHPAKTTDLYFVAAGALPADGHLFAQTYAQHQRNVAKWRAVEREAAKEAAAAAEKAREDLEAQQAQQAGDKPTGDKGAGQ